MAFFQYRAADQGGKIVEGVMEAEIEQSVISRLHEMGYVPLRISPPGGPGTAQPLSLPVFSRRKISQPQLLSFTQELGTLLGAGLPLDRSLSILGNLIEGEEFTNIIRAVLEAVRAGKSLAAAMTEHPGVFPKIYVNMIRAGESGGILEGVLRYLTEYMERSLALKDEIKSALMYPIILAGAAGLSLVVLFVYVIPRFALIFKDVGQALPWISKLVIDLSQNLTEYGWCILLGIIAGVAGIMFYLKTPDGRSEWD